MGNHLEHYLDNQMVQTMDRSLEHSMEQLWAHKTALQMAENWVGQMEYCLDRYLAVH